MRIAILKKEDCHPEKCGNYLCERICPVNRTGKECIVQGEDRKAFINTELCTGCGICPKKCPFDAITIVNLPESLKEQCVHQFGDKNGFTLFRSPIPIPKQVVGLLGQNGTGKTTALQIIEGGLKANLGTDHEATKEELSKFFAGSELQGYFANINKKKMAYKPQYVDKIPKMFKGKVKELLKKVDETKNLDNIAKEIGIENILDSEVSKISGGELQKVAIAACLLKDADIYFFDEPSSYLDIKERLKIAKIIRKLAEKKLVLIIEHDLIILDYLADLAHIFYGKPGAYGIVSHPKSIKEGINSYLEGFLQEENVQFRETPLKFIVKAASDSKKLHTIVEFKDLTKKFKNFALKVEKGAIHEKELIGVVGPNATGKTTFMKILAGELKSDTGSLSKKIKISYKPQYIKPDEDILVRIALKGVAQKVLLDLGLEKLLDRTLGELSGGELQKVSIAKCLSADADLYLLDEPSAHLDVEQRVNVANVIRHSIEDREKSAIIIDHDIMLLDYLSDRLMVFSGESGKTGEGKGPYTMKEGMNLFLKDLDITFRREEKTGRPRANKQDSVKDREQKKKGEYYYVK
jgi:ATP-binding cassette subfamily E protein 1